MFNVTTECRKDRSDCLYTLKIGDGAGLTQTISSNAPDVRVVSRLQFLIDRYRTETEKEPVVERDYGTKHVHQDNPKAPSEVLVWYDVLDVNGNFLMQTFDRYPNCTFEVNRAGVCKIYDADKKLIASVRGWKKVCYG